MNKINALLLVSLGFCVATIYFLLTKEEPVNIAPEPEVKAIIIEEEVTRPHDEPPPIKKYRDGHMGGYFWRAKNGESLKDIYELLYRKGWRFGTQSKSKGYDKFLARIKKHNPGKIKNEIVKKKTILDFSPMNRKKVKKPVINEQDYDFEWKLARVTTYMAGLHGDPWHNHKMKDIRFKWGCAIPQRAVRRLNLRDGDIVYVKGFGRLPLIDRVPRKSERKHEKRAMNRGLFIDLVVDVNVRAMGIVNKRQAIRLDKGICYVKVYRKKDNSNIIARR